MKFNPRIILFALVALALIGFPAYIFLDEKLSGGIKDRGDFLQVNLKAMSNFEFDQQNGQLTDIPEQWRNLNGKRIQVEGEMYNFQENGVFELVYSIANCCYTSAPQIQHFVLARPKPNINPELYKGLVRVTGTLHVNVQKSDGKITRIYILDVDNLQPI